MNSISINVLEELNIFGKKCKWNKSLLGEMTYKHVRKYMLKNKYYYIILKF